MPSLLASLIPFFCAAFVAVFALAVVSEAPDRFGDDPAPAPSGTTLVVTVEGLRSHKGVVAVNVFKGEKGFPGDDSRAHAKQIVPITEGAKTVTLRFANLPPGDFAVVLLHDENQNGKMDTGIFGIPREGFGASNNPKVRTGPPRFSDASFVVAEGESEHHLSIKTVYMGR